MRKLLILMLVLGVASVAFALPTITVSNASPLPGTTFEVYVAGTAADATGDGGSPVGGFSGGLALDYANYNWYNWPTTNPYISLNFTPVIEPEAGGGAVYGSGYGAAYFTAAPPGGDWSEATDVDASLWFTYTITVDEELSDFFDTQIDLIDRAIPANILASINIVLIPEPLTMALLGFGGLLLRRRN